jgi:hypothetical protein
MIYTVTVNKTVWPRRIINLHNLISNFYGSIDRFLGHWVQTKNFIYNIKRLRYGNGVYVKGLSKPFFTAVNSFPFYGYVTETVYM